VYLLGSGQRGGLRQSHSGFLMWRSISVNISTEQQTHLKLVLDLVLKDRY